MRNKIIAVNAVIVLMIGLLSYVLVRASVSNAASSTDRLLGEAKHAADGAASRIQLDGLRVERWIDAKASDPGFQEALGKASPVARGDAATAQCDALLAASKGAPAFDGRVPALVTLVDAAGRIVGRNGSSLSRGDDLGATYPSLKAALAAGQSGSDIFVNKERSDMYLASFAPVRDDANKIVGALIVGQGLNDVLSRASDEATRRGVLIVAPDGASASAGGWKIVARSSNTSQALADAVNGAASDAIRQGIANGHSTAVLAGDAVVGTSPLGGFGDGRRGALVVAIPASLIDNPGSIATPILSVMVLGLLLVVVGGWLLGSYIDSPIGMLEEGLLGILNGQTDKRFELEHAELGGLAFRIDQLLNQLMGVEEDNTDADGRPSMAPTPADYQPAMSVDQNRSAASVTDTLDPAAVARLAAEPEGAYYDRVYAEYIAAKTALNEATDHITRDAFVGRIRGMEQDAASKYGKPVRYQVKATGREVILLAVPLP